MHQCYIFRDLVAPIQIVCKIILICNVFLYFRDAMHGIETVFLIKLLMLPNLHRTKTSRGDFDIFLSLWLHRV